MDSRVDILMLRVEWVKVFMLLGFGTLIGLYLTCLLRDLDCWLTWMLLDKMQVGYWQFVWNCSMIMTNEICMFFLLFCCFRMKEQVRFYKGWLNEMCIFLCRTAASWTERPDVRCLWISWLLLLAGNGLIWNWCAILRFGIRWNFYGIEMSHVLMRWILYELLKELTKV